MLIRRDQVWRERPRFPLQTYWEIYIKCKYTDILIKVNNKVKAAWSDFI